MIAQDVKSATRNILALQVIVVGWAVALFWFFKGEQSAYSALLGGMAALIPNAYLARRIAGAANEPAKKIVRAFYRGESVKLLSTAVIFYLIFLIPDINYVALFVSFAAALTVFWFALILRKTE